MAIKIGKVSITDKQAKTIIVGAMLMVEDGNDSDPAYQGEIAGDLLRAGLIDEATFDDFVGT